MKKLKEDATLTNSSSSLSAIEQERITSQGENELEKFEVYRQWKDGVITIEEVVTRFICDLRPDLAIKVCDESFQAKQEELAKGIVR